MGKRLFSPPYLKIMKRKYFGIENLSEEDMEKAVRLNSTNPYILSYIGRLYSYRRRLEKAEELLEAAMNLFLKERKVKSIDDIIKLDPSRPEDRELLRNIRELALVKLKLSRFTESYYYMQCVLRFAPDDGSMRRLSAKLKGILGVEGE